MSIRYELNVTRSWYKRQLAKGITPSADFLWQRIRSSWPTLTEEEYEKIFQSCEPTRKERVK